MGRKTRLFLSTSLCDVHKKPGKKLYTWGHLLRSHDWNIRFVSLMLHFLDFLRIRQRLYVPRSRQPGPSPATKYTASLHLQLFDRVQIEVRITHIQAAGMVRTHAGGANGALKRLALVLGRLKFFPCIKFFAKLSFKKARVSYTNTCRTSSPWA